MWTLQILPGLAVVGAVIKAKTTRRTADTEDRQLIFVARSALQHSPVFRA
jgi:hypothetical protein